MSALYGSQHIISPINLTQNMLRKIAFALLNGLEPKTLIRRQRARMHARYYPFIAKKMSKFSRIAAPQNLRLREVIFQHQELWQPSAYQHDADPKNCHMLELIFHYIRVKPWIRICDPHFPTLSGLLDLYCSGFYEWTIEYA